MPVSEIPDKIKDKLPKVDLNSPHISTAISGSSFFIGSILRTLFEFFKVIVKALIDLVKKIRDV